MWKVKLWVGLGAFIGFVCPLGGCVIGEKYRKELGYKGHLNGREMMWFWGAVISMSIGMAIGGVTATYLFQEKELSKEM